jgi:dolichol-phosphate mannosyltransferase
MPQPRYHLTPRKPPTMLSLVLPVYNEAPMVRLLRAELVQLMDHAPYAFEVILINDGSSDNTLELLLEWAEVDRRVRILNFARNFGQQAAVTAGLDYARGDAVIVMDADLQDPPEVLFDMVREYCRGYDVVYGRRAERRGETLFKRLTSWAFYRLMRLLIHKDLPADVGDFRLISRKCLLQLREMRETHRFMRGLFTWVGFPQTSVEFVRRPRRAGETKYGIARMLQLAWTAAVSFSPAPLRLSFVAGLVFFALGITQGINAIVRSLLGLYLVPGWASIIIVNCLIGGSILMSIGVLGEYIGRIFEEVKRRPLYVVESAVNVVETPEAESVHRHELERLSEEVR